MQKDFFNKWAAATIALAGACAGLYLLLRYALPILFPFLFAYLFAVLTRPSVRRFSLRFGGHEKAVAIAVTAFFLCVFAAGCYLLAVILVSQAQNFLEYLIRDAENENGTIAAIFSFFRGFSSRVPFLSQLAESRLLKEITGDPNEFFGNFFRTSVAAWAEKVPSSLTALVSRLPAFLLFLLVTLIACFFTAGDYEHIVRTLCGFLPPRFLEKMPDFRRRFSTGVKRYLRAYFFLFMLTFGELFVGLLLLREKYAFLLAGVTAMLDIFPVLGVGTVLLPWAFFRLCTGNTVGGVLLLLLYIVITVVRQIAEPHFVGKSIGLHPLLMLISFYVGLKIFGFAGIFIGPFAALTVKAVFFPKTETPVP